MSDSNTTVTKNYYSLRAFCLILAPLCKSSMTNPSIAISVNLDHRLPELVGVNVTMTRPGYSGNGFFEGTESCAIFVPVAMRRDVLGKSSGIFDNLDSWLVDFDNVTFELSGPEEYSSEDDSADSYTPADEDFWFDEFQREVQEPVVNHMLTYTFAMEDNEGNKGRFWTMRTDTAIYSWNLDTLGTGDWDDHLINDLDGFSA